MQHAARRIRHNPGRLVPAVFVLALAASGARADEAMQWLARAAHAARDLDYAGTIVYQIGPRVESSRVTHLYDNGHEFSKLVNLDGPAREVVRSDGEVRCYYPDAKLVRIEPGTFRDVFPALLPEQLVAELEDAEIRPGTRTNLRHSFERLDGRAIRPTRARRWRPAPCRGPP